MLLAFIGLTTCVKMLDEPDATPNTLITVSAQVKKPSNAWPDNE